ncbi:MAG: hypothetical protein R6X20_01480, partial [Phycisphaerae bacterium]
MNAERFREITSRYTSLRAALVGDVALDRYLEIDPAIEETSLETGLAVWNVVRVRPQPGAGGNVLANLALSDESKLVFDNFFRKIYNSNGKKSCEISLEYNNKPLGRVYLEGLVTDDE